MLIRLKIAMTKSLDPTKYKMIIDKVTFNSCNSVIIGGESLNVTDDLPLVLGSLLIEVNPEVKMHPRLIIHDISVDLFIWRVNGSYINPKKPQAIQCRSRNFVSRLQSLILAQRIIKGRTIAYFQTVNILGVTLVLK